MKYEVIPARLWRRDDGASASIHGALPWRSEAEKARWQMVDVGWTVRNPITGQVGVGHPASPTKEKAQELADRLGHASAICIGD